MNITLYKAANDVRELLEQIDPETGELPAGFDSARDLVAAKAQAVSSWILQNEAEATVVEEHAKELLSRAKAARKRSDCMRAYLAEHMAACGILEIKADDGTFKCKLDIGRDESVDVFDESQLPLFYSRIKQIIAPNKQLIGIDLAKGVEVPGARLVKKDRLTLK